MDGKTHKNAVVRFFQSKRRTFESLQEMDFNRGERKLKELLNEDGEHFNYPIPTFVPIFLVWVFIIFFPLVFILDKGSHVDQTINAWNLMGFYLPLAMTVLIFVMNQRILVPRFVFKKKYVLYFVHNGLLVFFALFVREIAFFMLDRQAGEGLEYFFTSYCFSFVKGHFSIWTMVSFVILVSLVCIVCVVIQGFGRQLIRTFIRREQKRSELQYELDFLKNQLSPHFLFNTLNNISALIQIDPKRAEQSMTKLSKLLRVMLYQTTDDYIAIQEEVDILQKYADLEKLRLDETFEFVFDVQLNNPDYKVAPLVFMPLMENALKHSLNPKGKSFAHISIVQNNGEICFTAKNSNFPRKSQSKASGLGISTFQKRLDLLYAGKYKYTTSIADGVYTSILILTEG